jgi:hypothetical protein
MNNILFIGQSTLAAIYEAFKVDRVFSSEINTSWLAFPGGEGPDYEIIKGVPRPRVPPFLTFNLPTSYPSEAENSSLDVYDLVVVSSLGWIDGGSAFPWCPAEKQGLIYKFKPKFNNGSSNEILISEACYERIIKNWLHGQGGFKFLKDLRNNFKAKIILCRFPQPSEKLIEDEKWPLNLMYDNSLEAHDFFSQIRNHVVEEYSKSLEIDLLPFPPSRVKNFTNHEMMNVDAIHGNIEYAQFILNQINNVLTYEN